MYSVPQYKKYTKYRCEGLKFSKAIYNVTITNLRILDNLKQMFMITYPIIAVSILIVITIFVIYCKNH